jgi:hypothetical protein
MGLVTPVSKFDRPSASIYTSLHDFRGDLDVSIVKKRHKAGFDQSVEYV